MSVIEQFRGRWSSFSESDIDMFCELLADPDAFDARFEKYVCAVDEKGHKSFDFKGLCISNRVIKGGFFTGMDVSYMIFRNCKIVDTVFDGSTMNGCRFENCEINHCSFSSCVMPNCVFIKVGINGSFMNLVDLCEGAIKNASITETNLGSANLSSCELENIVGEKNYLNNTRLPSSQRNSDWWQSTSADSILWC